MHVSSVDGKSGAQKGITITTQNPEIVFYERSPSEGIKYENALPSGFDLTQEEITVRAEPYFFSTEDLTRDGTSFKWSLNDEEVRSSSHVNEITLRREQGAGIARIMLEARNTAKILQETTAHMLIRF